MPSYANQKVNQPISLHVLEDVTFQNATCQAISLVKLMHLCDFLNATFCQHPINTYDFLASGKGNEGWDP